MNRNEVRNRRIFNKRIENADFETGIFARV